MLSIKLQRIGKKHQPSYRLVVAEARSKMAAPPVEDLGSYIPANKAASFHKNRISYWLGIGAQPTVTVHNLLVREGIVTKPKLAIKMKKAEPKAAAPAEVGAKVEAVAEVSAEAQAEESKDEAASTEETAA